MEGLGGDKTVVRYRVFAVEHLAGLHVRDGDGRGFGHEDRRGHVGLEGLADGDLVPVLYRRGRNVPGDVHELHLEGDVHRRGEAGVYLR